MIRAFFFAACLLLASLPSRADVALRSAHAIVVDDDTGEVLLQKDGDTAAPIASLTKLMTAMVVLDAQLDPDEPIRIAAADLDRLKGTRAGVRVGTVVPRGTLLELALIVSDNHAAAAIARTYPGGRPAFDAAMRRKIESLGLTQTLIEEPTGLSPNNRSSAQDMAKVLRAAASYPTIGEVTSKRQHAVVLNGRVHAVNNTNRLVGAPGWNILLSKTGFTNEAGRCVSMRVKAAGRTVTVVLMGALGSSQRALDALNIRRWLAGEMPPAGSRSSARATGLRKRAAVAVVPGAMPAAGRSVPQAAPHADEPARPRAHEEPSSDLRV